KIADLHDKIGHFETHFSEHQALQILSGLGFGPQDYLRPLTSFSGGWRMRGVLAALLFQRPDLLLLDEPTNHLDLPSVAWFGAFLKRYSRAFVLVCHDREFLNEQIGRVVSFEPEGVRQFVGDYETYRRQRAEEEIVLENQARNAQREREKTEQFIDRFRAKASKAKAVQSRVKALERMGAVELFERRKVMQFHFPACARTGDQVLKINELAKSYGEHDVFAGVDLRVMRGEKIGIIGVNGAGKTTLLRILAGEIDASAGDFAPGHRVKMGYYAQHHSETLDKERTVYEEVAAQDPSAGPTRVRSILGAFLFSGDDVDKPIGVLSGGERARVALARLLVSPGNLLLMDEPTNHLDLESSESLAESLVTYDGTLMFVSHNRSFVRRLATTIWDVRDGSVEVYPGTLDEYLDSSRAAREADPNAAKQPDRVAPGSPGGKSKAKAKANQATPGHGKSNKNKKTKANKGAAKTVAPTPSSQVKRESAKDRRRKNAAQRAQRSKVLGPLKRKVEKIEAQIAALEQAQAERNTALTDPKTYDNKELRTELLTSYQKTSDELEGLTGAWEVLQGELEDAASVFDDS
ncbi:MAG: ABC-F family ATP-binding cassette domain-containing protein, partial [Nannocystaceae bacterium]